MRDRRLRLLAMLALGTVALAGLTLAPARTVAREASPRRHGMIPDDVPYDSTRGDSVGESALYLSWSAPYGMRGARTDITISCDDTTGVDTLYLSMETGRDLPHLCAMSARLTIRPLPGDSLGPFWRFGAGGDNRGGLLAQMDPDGTFPCAQPWQYPGIGGIPYEFDPGHGEVVVIYAVRPEDAVPVSGRTRYCFARLLFPHRRCALAGSEQPVCIEWWEGGYTGGGPDISVRKGPARFVSVNSAAGGACAACRRAGRSPVWRPPVHRGPAAPVPVRTPLSSPGPADSVRR